MSSTFISVFILIILNRPKPAYGRQGLANVSLRASGAQLGVDDFSIHTNTQTLHHNIYILILILIVIIIIIIISKDRGLTLEVV